MFCQKRVSRYKKENLDTTKLQEEINSLKTKSQDEDFL